MSKLKIYHDQNVLDAARERMAFLFSKFDSIYLSFSGGKDSTVLLHLAIEQAEKTGKTFGLLLIDLEAQYSNTITHAKQLIDEYKEFLDVYWVCIPMKLRNAVSNFQPTWNAWDEKAKGLWVREKPKEKYIISDASYFPFYVDNMEFEEFIVLFGDWYREKNKKKTLCLVGIRADESLNRFRTIASKTKTRYKDKGYTTKVLDGLYNGYPLYDWKTEDIWRFHSKYPEKAYNEVYELMNKAGVPLSQARLCQPYGDDQRRGLWLYHLLEPDTWYKLINRVNGVNSGALYIRENGNITGYNKIFKPENHTWQSFCKLILRTMPKRTRDHYIERFIKFIAGWKRRGYEKIPDEAPPELENKYWAPSWRRLCKVLLRNDWWCKGLGFTQPKSEAYQAYMEIKKNRKKEKVNG